MRDDNQSADPSLSISTFSPKRYQEQASPRGSLLSCLTNWFSGLFKTPFPFKTPCCTYNLPSPQTIYTYTPTHTPLPIITYQSETSLPFNHTHLPSPILNRVKGQLTPIFRLSCSWCSIPAHPIILVWQFPVSFGRETTRNIDQTCRPSRNFSRSQPRSSR